MGDRAIIVVTDGENVSQEIYLHWGGYAVPMILDIHRKLMESRGNDFAYAYARLVGVCHQHCGYADNMSLGVFGGKTPLVSELLMTEYQEKRSHGDAGFFVLDTRTYEWTQVGGYPPEALPKLYEKYGIDPDTNHYPEFKPPESVFMLASGEYYIEECTAESLSDMDKRDITDAGGKVLPDAKYVVRLVLFAGGSQQAVDTHNNLTEACVAIECDSEFALRRILDSGDISTDELARHILECTPEQKESLIEELHRLEDITPKAANS